MYKEIDLHGMNYEDALRIFIQKYNEMIRKKEKKRDLCNSWIWLKEIRQFRCFTGKITKVFIKAKGQTILSS